jgi:hypothetical protein
MTRDSISGLSRRGFLLSSSTAGIAGFLAGCNWNSNQPDETPDGTEEEFNRIGNEWITFGEANDWGMQFNQATNEFEIVHNPFKKESRTNIRIEADTSDDKGDLYVDDSLIVKNEVEVSDGSPNDPSYVFTKQNNTGLWRPGAGMLGISTRGSPAAVFDDGATRVAGDVTTTGSQRTTIWDSAESHAPNLPAVTATASGDGSTRTFSLVHPLSSTPEVATVTAASADAAGDFWVSAKYRDTVEITYASPPSAGEQNLSYEVIVSR